jgi:two-component system, cell cycle sensor histidine kinase and response regulator CckA
MQPSNARHSAGITSVTGERGLLLIVALAAIMSALLLLWVAGDAVLAAGFMAGVLAIGALVFAGSRLFPSRAASLLEFDWSLVREAADNDEVAVAVTDRIGRLVCANALHDSWFGGPLAPPALGLSSADEAALMAAGRVAWRDGRSSAVHLRRDLLSFDAEILRVGRSEDHLIWRERALERPE